MFTQSGETVKITPRFCGTCLNRTVSVMKRQTLIYVLMLLSIDAFVCACSDDKTAPKAQEGCEEGLVMCSGQCVDPFVEKAWCGANEQCENYVPCLESELCISGTCTNLEMCNSGQIRCDGTCIDPKNDNRFCGAKTSCKEYESCRDGTFCYDGKCIEEKTSCSREGEVLCDKRCIDPQRNDAYCGASKDCTGYAVCKSDETCAGGQCVSSKTDCCGEACDKCADNELCTEGVCRVACPFGKVEHNGVCVEEGKNCCGENCVVCTGKQECKGGICREECPDGAVYRDGSCISQSDACCGASCDYCGGLGYCSKKAECVCKTGAKRCGSECVNLSTDVEHCGACDNDCAEVMPHAMNHRCISGTCVSNTCKIGYYYQNGECKAYSSTSCGPSGNNCEAIDGVQKAKCVEEECKVSACLAGFHLVENECVEDTKECCGDLCIECEANEYCVQGACKLDCGDEMIVCDEECVSAKTMTHCGACNVSCEKSKIAFAESVSCETGVCQPVKCGDNHHPKGDKCVEDTAQECGAGLVNCPETVSGYLKGYCHYGYCEATECQKGYRLVSGGCYIDTPMECGDERLNCLSLSFVADADCENGKCVIKACSEGFHVKDGACVSDET